MLKRMQAVAAADYARHHGSRTYHEAYDGAPVLVIGRFDSQVTELEDLKAIFAQRGITVVTLSEIEAAA
jgi:hypothetical protein